MNAVAVIKLLARDIAAERHCLTLTEAYEKFCEMCAIHGVDNRVTMPLFAQLIRGCEGVRVVDDQLTGRVFVEASDGETA